jgi:hypothetical protein
MAQKNLSRYNRSSNKSHQSRSASLAENGLALRSRLVPTTDLLFENHFSLFLIRPTSPAGKAWLDSNISDDAQTLGEAVACEFRYVEAIYRGAIADGLVCR